MVTRPGGRRAAVAALLALFVLGSSPRLLAQDGPSEYEVKAAFLFNFGKFVQWPNEAFVQTADALVVGVLGDDPFDGALERMVASRSVQGKRIVVRRLKHAREVTGCHILFVSPSAESQWPAILKTLNGAPVLTVSDIRGFADRGGAINLYLDQRRVRFTVNLKATERARLKMSSQLLKVAAAIRS